MKKILYNVATYVLLFALLFNHLYSAPSVEINDSKIDNIGQIDSNTKNTNTNDDIDTKDDDTDTKDDDTDTKDDDTDTKDDDTDTKDDDTDTKDDDTDTKDDDTDTKDDDTDTKDDDNYSKAMLRYDTSFEFKFKDDYKYALFKREGYLWFAFNSIPFYTNIKKSRLSKLIQTVSSKGNLVFKVKVPNYIHPEIKFIHDKLVIHFGTNKITGERFNDPIVDGNEYGEKITVNGINNKGLIVVEDSVIGDNLLIITTKPDGRSIKKDYIYNDFQLLETYKGITIVPFTDNISVINTKDGNISIGDASIIKKFDNNEEIISDNKNKILKYDIEKGGVIYQLSKWHGASDYNVELKKITKIINSNSQDKLESRFKLVELYLAHKMYQEALSYLNYIRDIYDYSTKSVRYRLLYVLALYMNNEFNKASNLLNSITIEIFDDKQKEEIEFWKQFIKNKTTDNSNILTSCMEYIDRFIRYYDHLQEEIFLSELQSAINLGNIDLAMKLSYYIGKKIKLDNLNYYNILKARLMVAKGDIEDGIQLLSSIFISENDDKNKALALFEKINIMETQGLINTDDAITELEEIKFISRIDSKFEIELLYKMGALYKKKEDFYNTFSKWQEMIKYYPTSKYVFMVNKEMGKLFEYLFVGEGIEKIDNIESIRLYYEFEELIPIGRLGIEIVMEVVDRLLEINLLEKAIDLVKHMVEFRLTGKEKLIYVLKLASLYMEDSKIDEAQELLDNYDFINLQDVFYREYIYLNAKISIQKKEYQLAIDYLDGIFSERAQDVKEEVYWISKDWLPLMQMLERDLKYRNNPGGKLTAKEVNKVLKLVIAYSNTDKDKELKNLKEAFFDIMPENSRHILSLNTMTNLSYDIDINNVGSTANIQEINQLIKEYKNLIKDEIKNLN